MDEINRGETLRIDIARLLQFQSSLQSTRVAIACAQHDKVLGERVAQCLLTDFFFSLDDASQRLEDRTDVKGVPPDGVDQKQECRQRCSKGLRGGDTLFGSRLQK